MINFLRKHFFLIFLLLVVSVFFLKIFSGLFPIPADTIIGLYHPFRDVYAKDYPNGIPFKNFLITDPVRQIYPWKELAIDRLSDLKLPLWNPYEMAGKPLLGNFQSSPFYPLNLILFLSPFYLSWSLFISIQIFLCGIFMYLFLLNLKLRKSASVLGALAFSFSGFVVSWFEWGNVIHTALWLPLILLSIDKLTSLRDPGQNFKLPISNYQFQIKRNLIWAFIFIFSLASSFLAGHLQIFFYVSIFSFAYFCLRWFEQGKKLKTLGLFAICCLLFAMLTAVQLIPTLQFISLSARGIDQSFLSEGWFIPWQHLVQFIIPDFFGNPSTLNYWGIWNYGEFVGYVGIVPLVFAVYGVFFSKRKETYFFIGGIIAALIFSLQNPIAEIPFKLAIPFISSSQPTRLVFLVSFSLAVMSAIGFDAFLREKEVKIKRFIPYIGLITLFIAIWILNYPSINVFSISPENLLVVKRNLVFPTLILATGFFLMLTYVFVRNPIAKKMLIILFLVLISFDLLRFSDKFTPFSKKEYIFPNTKSVEFLKKDNEIFRVGSIDSRIFAPNFLTHYRIQSIEGYDPLYLKSYGEFIAASERGKPDIHPPFGFNRIITPHRYDSEFFNLLNIKYVFSLTDIASERYELVFEEGQTKIFKNNGYFPRTFFVESVVGGQDSQEQVNEMFDKDLSKNAIVEGIDDVANLSIGKAIVVKYEDNEIIIKTENQGDGFLVLSDAFYPTWEVQIDGKREMIYKTNLTFRGVFVPSGKHEVIFKNKLF